MATSDVAAGLGKGPDPLVSVLMPVWNGACYLRPAIDSIIAQTFSNFEILVVDDGSTDSSIEIAQSRKDPRLRIISRPHQGLVAALNAGIASAKGKYIARMDADDISLPSRLERQIGHMKGHPSTVILGCRYYTADEKGERSPFAHEVPTGGWPLRLRLARESPFVHGAVVICRDSVLQVGGYRDAFESAEDYDLWLRLAEVGSIGNLREPLYVLRKHPASKSALEGAMGKHFQELAQRLAMQRLLEGRDALGSLHGTTLTRPSQGGAHSERSRDREAATWAIHARSQRRWVLAFRLAQESIRLRPFDVKKWGILAWYFFTPGTYRTRGKQALQRAQNAIRRHLSLSAVHVDRE